MEGNPIDKQFDKIYSNHERTFGRVEDFVLKIPNYLKKGEILDVGAGQGRNAFWLAKEGFKVEAHDISEAGVNSINEVAKERNLSLSAVKIDARSEIKKNYEGIVAAFIFHYMSDEEALTVINNIKTHTKSGGVNIICAFTKIGDFYRIQDGGFFLEQGQLRELYSDWEILEYEEKEQPSVAKNQGGVPMVNLTAKIIARKK